MFKINDRLVEWMNTFRYKHAQHVLNTSALEMVLISKGIITQEELDQARNTIAEDPTIKSSLEEMRSSLNDIIYEEK